ncbi:hypothetical protein [Carboxydothermus pertinax]|uniref:hypothetical protein n=1 Tax=Carboxydothermus pertinax TaxID=870242 RepID=UPI00096AB66B|nr:hypothetical protein [Carboxydothermus pertinax]
MAKEKASFSSYFLFGFLISTVFGFIIGNYISDLPNIQGRFNLWWKDSIVIIILTSFYVQEYLISAENLPIQNLTSPPKSRFEFLKQIAIIKHTFLTIILIFPALAISILIIKIPIIIVLSYLPGMVMATLAAGTWGTAINLNSELIKTAWKRNFIYPAILLPFIFIFAILTVIINPKVSNFILNTTIGNSIVLFLFSIISFIVILEDSYRSIRQYWTSRESHNGEDID